MATRPAVRRTPWNRVAAALLSFTRVTPPRLAILIFLVMIMVFTILFSLPISSADGSVTTLQDALFTAVSVVCVTGLATVDMATHWSGFGHAFIIVGVQVGGVGVLTMASMLGLVMARRLGLRQRLMAAGDSNPMRSHGGPVAEGQAVSLGEIGGLLRTVAVSMLVIEVGVAALLFPRVLINEANGTSMLESLWHSLYFSIMAFTNTGFSPTVTGLEPYLTDYWFLTVLMIGVFLGSIGFPVIYVLSRNLKKPKRWSLHVKLTLLVSAILIVLGTLAYSVLEWDNSKTMGSMPPGDRVFQSLFLSVMTRSGGFATVDIAELNNSSLFITDILMFIGGGSASTGGGIKVTTLAVLFLAAFAEARGINDMEAFGRRIPQDVLRLSVSILIWGVTTVSIASVLLMEITDLPFDYVLFDVISAFGTTGLSIGLTEQLPASGVYVLSAVMFMGRIGTVTLAAALAARQRSRLFQHAEERPIVG